MPAILPAFALLFAALFGAPAATPAKRPAADLLGSRVERLLGEARKTRPAFRRALPLWQLDRFDDLVGGRLRRRIRRSVERVAGDGSLPVPLRRLATGMLASMLRSAGESERAERVFDSLGYIRDWWVVGPFDNRSGHGYRRQFLPEAEIDFDRQFEGKGHPVRFRKIPRTPADGVVKLHAFLRPQTRAVAYAFSVVHVRHRTPVLIEAGCDDACKVWINGKLLIDDPDIHQYAADQDIVSASLAPGDNRVLVKVVQNEGAWSFSLAISDRRGRALRHLGSPADERALRAALAGAQPQAPAAIHKRTNLAEMFRERAAGRSKDPVALAEAAFALTLTRAGDSRKQESRRLLLQAQELLPSAGGQACRLAIMLAHTTADADLAARLLEQAASQKACRAEARALLGHHYQIRNRLIQALTNHRLALRTAPGYLPAELGEVEVLDGLQLWGLADRGIERLLREHPDVPEVLRVAGGILRMRRDIQRSRETYLRLLDQRADDGLGLRALYELAVARGDLPAAEKWMDRSIELAPERIDHLLERGDLLLYNGQPAGALADYRRASAICPRDAQALVRQGTALMALGREKDTLKVWQRALKISPQDDKLRKRVEYIQKSSQSFYAPFRRDWRDFVARDKWCVHAPCQGAGALRLLDLTVVRLHPNGLSSRFRQQLIGIIDNSGADAEHAFGIEYAPGRQQVRILANRVLHPDGSVDESSLIDDFSVSEPWYNLYYDVHTRQVTFPVLSPGDLIELDYLVDDVDSRGFIDGYFGDLAPFQFAEPAADVRYVLLSTDGLPLFFNKPATSQRRLGQQVIRTWEEHNQQPVEPETDMPGFLQTHSYLHLSSYGSWQHLVENYLALLNDQLVAGPEVRRLALSRTKGLAGKLDKIRALYRLVADSVRYVGLEFGIHSYVPYPVSQVLARNYGDCKDKASLLVSLLGEVGVKADLALVRTSPYTKLGDSPASFAVFDHAICYLPNQKLWLDPTVPYLDIVDLPPRDQNAPALIVSRDTRGLVTTPASGPDHNKTAISFTISPRPDGGAHVEASVSVIGSLAPTMRALYIGASSKKHAFENSINDLFPGAAVGKLNLVNLLRPDLPLISKADFDLADIGRKTAGSLSVPALGRNTIYQKIFAVYQSRVHDLVFGPPWSVDWQVTWRLPAGWRVAELPPGGRLENDFGLAHISTKSGPDRVVISAGLRIDRGLITAKDYQAFRDFLGRADRLLGGRFVLVAPASAGEKP